MYRILLHRKIYTNENQSNEMLGLCSVLKKLCAKMMFSLLLRLQTVNCFVPGWTGCLRQMGLIVVTIKHWLFVLQQPILIGWD